MIKLDDKETDPTLVKVLLFDLLIGTGLLGIIITSFHIY